MSSAKVNASENVVQPHRLAVMLDEGLRKHGAGELLRERRSGEGRGKKRDGSSGTVYVVDGETLRPVSVQLGITDNRNTEVSDSELKAGDRVVIGENPTSTASKPSSVGMRLF